MRYVLFFAIFNCSHSLSFAQVGPVSSPGFDIMTSRQLGNCIACHEVPGVEGLVSNFGPSLKGVGRKWSAADLRQWIKDARQLQANTLMPPFGTLEDLNKSSPPQAILSDAQINQVVETLQTWQ
jgi:sulfur-oxidizing protein SoxX